MLTSRYTQRLLRLPAFAFISVDERQKYHFNVPNPKGFQNFYYLLLLP
ncbi:MAG: hypothetical protein ACI81W_002304 [Saprospiraceae bacterium]|jgi:hypothetical protein